MEKNALAANLIAFQGHRRLASGPAPEVVRQAKTHLKKFPASPILVLDATTSRPIEIDAFLQPLPPSLSSRPSVKNPLPKKSVPSVKSVVKIPTPTPSGSVVNPIGRPRLGVTSREVTLLPRHWDWLATQPGGASATLRRLVEDARKTSAPADRKREAQESAYRFLTTLAGNLPGYEEALRALYANHLANFKKATAKWPKDIRAHATQLARSAFKS